MRCRACACRGAPPPAQLPAACRISVLPINAGPLSILPPMRFCYRVAARGNEARYRGQRCTARGACRRHETNHRGGLDGRGLEPVPNRMGLGWGTVYQMGQRMTKGSDGGVRRQASEGYRVRVGGRPPQRGQHQKRAARAAQVTSVTSGGRGEGKRQGQRAQGVRWTGGWQAKRALRGATCGAGDVWQGSEALSSVVFSRAEA